MPVIDAHQHFWELDRLDYAWLKDPAFTAIDRSFTPGDLSPLLDAAGVDKTVLVQSADSAQDTDYMLGIADGWGRIAGVVGWVPLLDPRSAASEIERGTEHPAFVGVRHLIHNEPDGDWVIQEPVIESLRMVAARGLTFDVVAVQPRHLEHVVTLADTIPDLRLVIDHLAKPPVVSGGWEPWSSLLADAAARPNVLAKISGIATSAGDDSSTASLQPYVDRALALFGAERLMMGGDWPVATLSGDYADVWAAQLGTISQLSEPERAAIIGGTAISFYGLAP